MGIKLKFKIGGTLVEVVGNHEEDVIKEASFWQELPCECGLCQSKNLGFRFRSAKEYDFYELRCRDCKATYALGQKMGGGLYPRGHKETGEWEQEYQGNGGGRDERRDERTDTRRQDPRDRSDRDHPSGDRRQDTRRQDDRRQDTRTQDTRGGRGNDDGGRGRQEDTRAQNRAAGPPAGERGPITDGLDDDDIPF